jgi:hypothetical protein
MPIAIVFGIAKGVVLVVVMGALGIEFVDQLIVAGTSAIIGACGIVMAARIAAREAREARKAAENAEAVSERNAEDLKHVKRGLGIDRRSGENDRRESWTG